MRRYPATSGEGPLARCVRTIDRAAPPSLPGGARRLEKGAELGPPPGCECLSGGAAPAEHPRTNQCLGLRSSFRPPLPLYFFFIPSKYVLTFAMFPSPARSWGQTEEEHAPPSPQGAYRLVGEKDLREYLK